MFVFQSGGLGNNIFSFVIQSWNDVKKNIPVALFTPKLARSGQPVLQCVKIF